MVPTARQRCFTAGKAEEVSLNPLLRVKLCVPSSHQFNVSVQYEAPSPDCCIGDLTHSAPVAAQPVQAVAVTGHCCIHFVPEQTSDSTGCRCACCMLCRAVRLKVLVSKALLLKHVCIGSD